MFINVRRHRLTWLNYCKLPKSMRSVCHWWSIEYTITRFVCNFLRISFCSSWKSTSLNHFWIFFFDTLLLAIWCKELTPPKLPMWFDPDISSSLKHKILLLVKLIRNRITLHRFLTQGLLFKWILSTFLCNVTLKKIVWPYLRIDTTP